MSVGQQSPLGRPLFVALTQGKQAKNAVLLFLECIDKCSSGNPLAVLLPLMDPDASALTFAAQHGMTSLCDAYLNFIPKDYYKSYQFSDREQVPLMLLLFQKITSASNVDWVFAKQQAEKFLLEIAQFFEKFSQHPENFSNRSVLHILSCLLEILNTKNQAGNKALVENSAQYEAMVQPLAERIKRNFSDINLHELNAASLTVLLTSQPEYVELKTKEAWCEVVCHFHDIDFWKLLISKNVLSDDDYLMVLKLGFDRLNDNQLTVREAVLYAKFLIAPLINKSFYQVIGEGDEHGGAAEEAAKSCSEKIAQSLRDAKQDVLHLLVICVQFKAINPFLSIFNELFKEEQLAKDYLFSPLPSMLFIQNLVFPLKLREGFCLAEFIVESENINFLRKLQKIIVSNDYPGDKLILINQLAMAAVKFFSHTEAFKNEARGHYLPSIMFCIEMAKTKNIMPCVTTVLSLCSLVCQCAEDRRDERTANKILLYLLSVNDVVLSSMLVFSEESSKLMEGLLRLASLGSAHQQLSQKASNLLGRINKAKTVELPEAVPDEHILFLYLAFAARKKSSSMKKARERISQEILHAAGQQLISIFFVAIYSIVSGATEKNALTDECYTMLLRLREFGLENMFSQAHMNNTEILPKSSIFNAWNCHSPYDLQQEERVLVYARHAHYHYVESIFEANHLPQKNDQISVLKSIEEQQMLGQKFSLQTMQWLKNVVGFKEIQKLVDEMLRKRLFSSVHRLILSQGSRAFLSINFTVFELAAFLSSGDLPDFLQIPIIETLNKKIDAISDGGINTKKGYGTLLQLLCQSGNPELVEKVLDKFSGVIDVLLIESLSPSEKESFCHRSALEIACDKKLPYGLLRKLFMAVRIDKKRAIGMFHISNNIGYAPIWYLHQFSMLSLKELETFVKKQPDEFVTGNSAFYYAQLYCLFLIFKKDIPEKGRRGFFKKIGPEAILKDIEVRTRDSYIAPMHYFLDVSMGEQTIDLFKAAALNTEMLSVVTHYQAWDVIYFCCQHNLKQVLYSLLSGLYKRNIGLEVNESFLQTFAEEELKCLLVAAKETKKLFG